MSRGKPTAKGLVYFMRRADGVGPVKIGCSKLPERRLQALQIWSPETLEIVAAVPGSFADETRLHRQFAAYRLHGEWFEAAPPVLAAMARAATLGELPPKPANDRNVRIMARYAAGDTYEDIAAEFGVSRQRIEQIVRKEGGTKRGHQGKRTCVAWERIEEVRALAADGLCGQAIAEHIGENYQNVLRVARKQGITLTRAKKARRPKTVQRAFDIASDYKAGLKGSEIAQKHGIQQPHVYTFLRIAGVKPVRRPRTDLNHLPMVDILAAYEGGATLLDLASEHDCATATVRRLLLKRGVLRNREENERVRIERVKDANKRRHISGTRSAA